MGLVYDSGDASSVKSALSANLTAATSVLDAAQNASARLQSALGTGELSGKGYSAVNSLFAQIIAPCIADAKSATNSVRSELEKFTFEDSKVSQYGVLKEDELEKQVTATRNQRDATQHQIEVNRAAADSSTAVPGLCDALQEKNRQLGMVLNQLENDLRELEAKLQALRDFAAATRGLFHDSLSNLANTVGDTVDLLNGLTRPMGGASMPFTVGGIALGGIATRNKILDYLAGAELTTDGKGRVKLGNKFLYDPKSNHHYRLGEDFNEATGTRIGDYYSNPLKAGGRAALRAPIDDFTGWKGATKLTKFGKGLGVAGTLLTVGGDVYEHFGEGGDGDGRKFAVDVGVDLAGAAAAAGMGAAAGSLFFPPIGTVVGAGVGIGVNLFANAPIFDGKSALDLAKDGIKSLFGW